MIDSLDDLIRTVETNHHHDRHVTQIGRLYGDKDRKEKLYSEIPIAMCSCDICVEMAKEVYGEVIVLNFQVKQLQELVKHCWVHSGYQDCGSEHMTTSQKILYKNLLGVHHSSI